MNATTLKTLYEAQLEKDLQPPVHPHVDRRATRCMLYISRRMPAGELKEANPGRIWIWSDLHLGHTATISSFARPPVREFTGDGRRPLPQLAPHGHPERRDHLPG